VTSWGLVLIIAFIGLGVSRTSEKKAYRRALAVTSLLVLAVSVGVL
jgi:hypothetical protein